MKGDFGLLKGDWLDFAKLPRIISPEAVFVKPRKMLNRGS